MCRYLRLDINDKYIPAIYHEIVQSNRIWLELLLPYSFLARIPFEIPNHDRHMLYALRDVDCGPQSVYPRQFLFQSKDTHRMPLKNIIARKLHIYILKKNHLMSNKM